MLAILTQTMAVNVDDETEAASLAIKMEQATRLQFAHQLEMEEDERITSEALAEYIAICGVSVTIVPDAVRQGP